MSDPLPQPDLVDNARRFRDVPQPEVSNRSKRTLLDDLLGGSVPNVRMPVAPSATFLSPAEGAIVICASRILKFFERYSAASDKLPVVLRLTISMWLRKL
jgi:hypothetical protein